MSVIANGTEPSFGLAFLGLLDLAYRFQEPCSERVRYCWVLDARGGWVREASGALLLLHKIAFVILRQMSIGM